MPEVEEYEVEVQRTVYAIVKVKDVSPQAVLTQVKRTSFPLPPVSEWETLKGEEIIIRDKDGDEVLTYSV